MTQNLKQRKSAYKAAKKEYKRARRKNVSGWKFLGVLSTGMTVTLAGVTAFLGMFDNTIAAFVGGSFHELVNPDENAIYFPKDYSSVEEMIEKGDDLCYQLEAEGAALLVNNGALPLAKGAKVSTFSSSSVDLVYGGTGSGNVDASKALNLKQSLEASGLEVNETLWNYYTEGEGQAYRRTSGSGESAVLAGHASINDVPWDKYPQNVKDSFAEYGDAVIITFSRVGGEGYDLNFGGEGFNENLESLADYNYLALSKEEKEMLQAAEDMKAEGTIDNIIVLINTSNALQVDFLKEYDVDACLWVGGLGIKGTEAVADIIAGEVNPSGSLVDTYCYDNYSSPAMQNFKATKYAGDLEAIPSNASTYMVYQEGIYVGYKYYETRYEDYVMGTGNAGNYQYDEDVAFTFGYGLSYTTFEYSNFNVNYNSATDQYEVSVKVTNTGAVDGKETVQIYAQSPYTDYDKQNSVEKASVNLVGFGKTNVIKAGESETLQINVDKRDLASYDAYGAKTYILDAGNYYLTAATDAHNAVNNVLAAKGYTTANTDGRMDANGDVDLTYTWVEDFDAVSYSTSLNGTVITNQLECADANLYFGANTVEYLSRSNWVDTWPTETIQLTLNDQMIKELQEGRYNTMPEYYEHIPAEWNTMPTLDAKNGMKLYDMFEADYDEDGVVAASDYDDPAWKKLLENVTINELIAIGDSFHWRMPLVSIHAPGTRDENGPQGLTASLLGSNQTQMKATAFTSEDVMAATFNVELMTEVGKMIGNNCLWAGVSCLYGPGANTHRTPYGGRNFEYYSEDGFLAGEMGGAEVGGIQSKGVDVVMKHFALNDCEQDRLGQAAWITEQAAREIYLKGFQKSLEESDGNGIMTAYTRWGTTWSGANYGLMTNIMRKEWGNTGMSITDNILVTYTDAVDAVIAGGVTCFDAMLWYATDSLSKAQENPVAVNAMVEAMHHNLYALINSAGMNGVGPNTTVKTTKLVATVVCEVGTWIFGALLIISIIPWIRGNLNIKEEKKAMKEAKKAYKKAKKAE